MLMFRLPLAVQVALKVLVPRDRVTHRPGVDLILSHHMIISI